MSTAFILSPSAELKHSEKTLNLLPFSLGPSQNPYSVTEAPISSFFIPRPAPPNFPSVPAGQTVASFRGRTVVAQEVAVPQGFQGVILSTSKRPDRGGLEERRDQSSSSTKFPLTPASSTVSAGDTGDTPSTSRPVRATRGAGQVALSRPVARAPPKRAQARKRIRLDSDDEDEEATPSRPTQDANAEEEEGGVKMERSLRSTPKKRKTMDVVLPAITVQAPTPRKARTAPVVSYETEDHEGENLDDNREEDKSDAAPEQEVKPEVESNIVPSPATENDPPAFPTSPAPTATEEAKAEPQDEPSEPSVSTDIDGAVRVLRPTSTFSSITLWTADAPLAGFRADEGEEPKSSDATSGDNSAGEEAKGGALRKGWWRVGGAGEGGDEFVRGLGEWLGLVEMINRPIYLEGLNDEDGVHDA